MISAVFFLRCERLLDRSRLADLFVYIHEGPAQVLVLAERRNLGLRLALCRRAGETLGHCLAVGFIGQARVRRMTRVIVAVAMTRWSAATSTGCGDGARTEVA
jgi:hypothetical protein